MIWQKVNKAKGVPKVGTECIVLCKNGSVHRAERLNDWYGGWRTGYGNDASCNRGQCLSDVTHFIPFQAP